MRTLQTRIIVKTYGLGDKKYYPQYRYFMPFIPKTKWGWALFCLFPIYVIVWAITNDWSPVGERDKSGDFKRVVFKSINEAETFTEKQVAEHFEEKQILINDKLKSKLLKKEIVNLKEYGNN